MNAVHLENEYYGVVRLSIQLGWSRNKTRRIRSLAGLVIETATKKQSKKAGVAEITAPTNALAPYAKFRNNARPQDGMSYSSMTDSGGWVQDFTYLWFERSMHYLAVVLDLKTRRVVGWRLGLRHTSELTHSAMLDALSKHPQPTILHSDQGSEYLSHKHQDLCDKLKIVLSCSTKASPWQNGFMERFFGGFKLELGKLSQYTDLAKLHEAIALNIYYYNNKRIHTSLGMSPAQYAKQLTNKGSLRIDKVFRKKVA
jgi:transposase InsO family protein